MNYEHGQDELGDWYHYQPGTSTEQSIGSYEEEYGTSTSTEPSQNYSNSSQQSDSSRSGRRTLITTVTPEWMQWANNNTLQALHKNRRSFSKTAFQTLFQNHDDLLKISYKIGDEASEEEMLQQVLEIRQKGGIEPDQKEARAFTRALYLYLTKQKGLTEESLDKVRKLSHTPAVDKARKNEKQKIYRANVRARQASQAVLPSGNPAITPGVTAAPSYILNPANDYMFQGAPASSPGSGNYGDASLQAGVGQSYQTHDRYSMPLNVGERSYTTNMQDPAYFYGGSHMPEQYVDTTLTLQHGQGPYQAPLQPSHQVGAHEVGQYGIDFSPTASSSDQVPRYSTYSDMPDLSRLSFTDPPPPYDYSAAPWYGQHE